MFNYPNRPTHYKEWHLEILGAIPFLDVDFTGYSEG